MGIYIYIYLIGNWDSSFQYMELSQKNIVGSPRPLSSGDVAVRHSWLSMYDKNFDLGKTIIQRVARKVEGRLLLKSYLGKLDASFVGMFKRADLTTEENIQL